MHDISFYAISHDSPSPAVCSPPASTRTTCSRPGQPGSRG